MRNSPTSIGTRSKYLPIKVDEQVEVASLVGDIALADGKPALHLHAVLGRRDGTEMAGHLQAHLRKVMDKESGLALIRADVP